MPNTIPKSRKRSRIAVAVLALLLVVFVGGWYERNRSAIETTLEWARLAPLPVSMAKVHVEVTGSMFTREFRLTFRAQPDVVDEWLKSSDGILDAEMSKHANMLIKYAIHPGGGAQFAQVIVYPKIGQVEIRAYWS
jgi:hypothetical protein